jgi:hypothetical protein
MSLWLGATNFSLMILYCGLYNKHITIVNDNSSIGNTFEASLTDEARVIIYDRHMFIVQATDLVSRI